VISQVVDRVLNRVAIRMPGIARPDVLEFHRSIPVVDLVVGTVLFRRDVLAPIAHGHVDLPRLESAGVDLVGLTIATRFPNLRGTLSGPHFRSLGLPADASNMALAEALIARIRGWAADTNERLQVVGAPQALDGMGAADRRAAARDRVRAFIGAQGGHVLDGDIANVERLASLGVRMLALSHVMDNELVGSGSGATGVGLTPFGREVIGELERCGVVVDLAHMSSAGIRDSLEVMRRPFVVSHTGFTERAGARRLWTRYSAATRNLSRDDTRLVAQAGGVIGVTLSTLLIGGRTLDAALDSFAYAAELASPEQVALGSDFDGALETVFDVTGLPLLTQGLLDRGFSRPEVAGMMGGNAVRVLAGAWPP
jgi:microsomal dipeptidase-like Zn-dependent dipeptidase